MPVSWKVVITFLSSIIGFIPNRTFWIVSLLHSLSRYVIIVSTNSITTKDLYLNLKEQESVFMSLTVRV